MKYEIAVIELDLENDDPKVKEIFQRINRTSNSLTAIEKIASEYSTSEFMLVAKLLSDQIDFPNDNPGEFRIDPNIPPEFYAWAQSKHVEKIVELLTQKGVFTSREIARKSHLQHVLNMMATYLGGTFNRNDKANDFLNDYAIEFPGNDELIEKFEKSASIILSLRLKLKSYWFNKANIFSLITVISKGLGDGVKFDLVKLKEELIKFEEDIPEIYKLAATEAVNSTKSRTTRSSFVRRMLEESRL